MKIIWNSPWVTVNSLQMVAMIILSIFIISCKKFLTAEKGARDGIEGGQTGP